MATVTTTEFVREGAGTDDFHVTLLDEKSLSLRLKEEIARAVHEFARDPAGFVRGLLSPEARDAKRRRLIYSGLTIALLLHAVALAFIVSAGWHRFLDRPQPPEVLIRLADVPRIGDPAGSSEAVKPETTRGDNGSGGGGGGNQSAPPASAGVLPRTLPRPQLVSFHAPAVPLPSLPVEANIVGPIDEPPPPGPLGDPESRSTESSGGPGRGGGIGSGEGTGVGNNAGPGGGPGRDGGPGHGGSGTGAGAQADPNAFAFNKVMGMPGYVGIRWISRPTPVVTPEAQAEKVTGVVLLRATFTADGAITNIEVVMPVAHMTESAVESLRRSRFRPATVNGRPITLYRVPIRIDVHVNSTP